MKTIKSIFLISIILFSTQWIACSEEEEENLTPIAVSAQEIDGTYLIVSFIDDGMEIVEQFGTNRAIDISSNKGLFFPNTSFYGIWDFIDDNSEIEMEISVGNSPYDKFENDWVIVKFEGDELWLYDDDFFDDDDPDADDDLEQVRLQLQD